MQVMELEPFQNIMKEYESQLNEVQVECLAYESTGIERNQFVKLNPVLQEKLSYHEVVQNPKDFEEVNSSIHICVQNLYQLFTELSNMKNS